jgi:hypothetical protein
LVLFIVVLVHLKRVEGSEAFQLVVVDLSGERGEENAEVDGNDAGTEPFPGCGVCLVFSPFGCFVGWTSRVRQFAEVYFYSALSMELPLCFDSSHLLHYHALYLNIRVLGGQLVPVGFISVSVLPSS